MFSIYHPGDYETKAVYSGLVHDKSTDACRDKMKADFMKRCPKAFDPMKIDAIDQKNGRVENDSDEDIADKLFSATETFQEIFGISENKQNKNQNLDDNLVNGIISVFRDYLNTHDVRNLHRKPVKTSFVENFGIRDNDILHEPDEGMYITGQDYIDMSEQLKKVLRQSAEKKNRNM